MISDLTLALGYLNQLWNKPPWPRQQPKNIEVSLQSKVKKASLHVQKRFIIICANIK